MKSLERFLLGAALALGMTAAPAPIAAQERYSGADYVAVSNALICQCGCNLPLGTCGMDNCHSAMPMREEIRERLSGGEGADSIVASFVDRYGLAVLSAPPAEGFHLSAWIVPFLALVTGAFVIQRVLSSWRRGSPAAAGAENAAARAGFPVSDDLRRRIETELEDYEG